MACEHIHVDTLLCKHSDMTAVQPEIVSELRVYTGLSSYVLLLKCRAICIHAKIVITCHDV